MDSSKSSMFIGSSTLESIHVGVPPLETSGAKGSQAPIAGDDPGPAPHLPGPGADLMGRITPGGIGFRDDFMVSYGIIHMV